MSIWTILTFVTALIIIALPVKIIAGLFQKGKTGICTQCGFQGQAKRETKGSLFIEIILWLAFIVPGLIYSIWRLTTRHEACPSCGSAGMIPLDSPRGQQLRQQFSAKNA